MRVFSRSTSGLNNAALFRRADYLLYTEGDSLSRGSLDALFWQYAADQWLPGKTVRVKPVGCKRVVRSIATNIVARNLKGSLAAMDRDYDERCGWLIDDPRVIYTSGYSIENDLYNQESLLQASEVILRKSPLPAEVSTDISHGLGEVENRFKRLVTFDYIYFRSGHAIIDRDNPGRAVRLTNNGSAFPGVNVQGLRGRILAAKATGPRWHGPIDAVSSVRSELVGKIWEYISYHVLVVVLKLHVNNLRVTKDHVCDLILEAWRGFATHHSASPLNAYYASKFAVL